MRHLFSKFALRSIVLFLSGIALFACKTNYVLLTIETPRPAKEQLPDDIQSITLMNRSMNNQFSNYPEDSLQVYFYKKGFQVSKIVLDSLASDTTILALADLMSESGRYQVVVPADRNLSRYSIGNGTSGLLSPIVRNLTTDLPYEILPDTLSRISVSKICQTYNTDALLVLERFYTKVMTDYSHERSGSNDFHYANIDLKYDAYFRIYKPGLKPLVKEFELTDTIYWENADYVLGKLFNKLPSVKEAMINAAIKVALEVDERLSPAWIPEKRGYERKRSRETAQ